MKTIDELRSEIDKVDDALLSLLDQRASLAKQIGKIKKENTKPDEKIMILDPKREQQIFDRLQKYPLKNFPKTFVPAVFKEIIHACRSIQEIPKVAFLGPEGTFSSVAAREAFNDSAEYTAADSIEAVFNEVSQGKVRFGVVPVENSIAGLVATTAEILKSNQFKIVRELDVVIENCLVSKEREISRLKVLYSHPMALSQCRKWIQANLPDAELRPSASTAQAAELAMQNPNTGAISSAKAAELVGANILARGIQDVSKNTTRFAVVEKV